MIDLETLTIEKVRKAYKDGLYSCEDLVKAYLAEIEKKDKDIHAYLEVFSDALTEAKEADQKIKAGVELPLLGIPFAIKDNILIKGRIASSASKILENYKATYDATVIQKLKNAGAIFIGRTNMDEFAMGGSTENSAYGVTRNPHDLERVAGGSSGGSAASVGGKMALVALGSDTGGSIRQPASFCGAVGFKPSYGRVSRFGVMAMGSSLDQIGPFASTVTDAEIVDKVIAGFDTYDSTSVKSVGTKALKKKIGIVPALLDMDGIDKEVKENFFASVERFKRAGYEIIEVDLPNISYSLPVYYVLMPAEVSSNMARFDGVKFGSKLEGKDLLEDYMKTRGELLGKEVRRRILLGTYVLSAGYYDAYYGKANRVKELIKRDFDKAFEIVDAVLTPTAPTPAFKIGEKTSNPIEMYLADIFTVTANLIGCPGISIPSGFTKSEKQLPLGVQLVGPYLQDESLFEIGKAFESTK
jgi:aspartyl-tRNA(Asn)/glutamyl-tRNA(Gln) amidotransferase subunit A